MDRIDGQPINQARGMEQKAGELIGTIKSCRQVDPARAALAHQCSRADSGENCGRTWSSRESSGDEWLVFTDNTTVLRILTSKGVKTSTLLLGSRADDQ
jgi:hypothetical protein